MFHRRKKKGSACIFPSQPPLSRSRRRRGQWEPGSTRPDWGRKRECREPALGRWGGVMRPSVPAPGAEPRSKPAELWTRARLRPALGCLRRSCLSPSLSRRPDHSPANRRRDPAFCVPWSSARSRCRCGTPPLSHPGTFRWAAMARGDTPQDRRVGNRVGRVRGSWRPRAAQTLGKFPLGAAQGSQQT